MITAAWAPRQVPYYPPGHDYRVSRKGAKRQVTPDLTVEPLETQPGFMPKADAEKLAAELNSKSGFGVRLG